MPYIATHKAIIRQGLNPPTGDIPLSDSKQIAIAIDAYLHVATRAFCRERQVIMAAGSGNLAIRCHDFRLKHAEWVEAGDQAGFADAKVYEWNDSDLCVWNIREHRAIRAAPWAHPRSRLGRWAVACSREPSHNTGFPIKTI